MFKIMKRVSVVACALALICFAAFPVLSARTENRVYAAEENGVKLTAPAENETTIDVQAEETNEENAKSDSTGSKAIAAGQPEATSQIRSGMMLGLVFIETAIIYALIVAILIIFVL